MTLDDCPEIDGIRVDLDALRALAHRCDPVACIDRERGCCETYEVYVDPREMGTLVGSMPNAARYAKNLKRNGAFAGPFEDTDGGSCLATNLNGRCVFAYRDKAGASLCSLHSAGIDMGLEPFKVKPKACALWPLYLIEGDTPVLTVQPGALDFPCNKKRGKSAAKLHAGVRDIIEIVFGREFLAKLETVIA